MAWNLEVKSSRGGSIKFQKLGKLTGLDARLQAAAASSHFEHRRSTLHPKSQIRRPSLPNTNTRPLKHFESPGCRTLKLFSLPGRGIRTIAPWAPVPWAMAGIEGLRLRVWGSEFWVCLGFEVGSFMLLLVALFQ